MSKIRPKSLRPKPKKSQIKLEENPQTSTLWWRMLELSDKEFKAAIVKIL